MIVVVFLGPSLPRDEASALLPDAHYWPPAKQSDVITALTVERPAAIALIDGEFHQTRSVWHKELLFALEQGVPLYGSSSMGALRAAELAPFGMRGRGEVFSRYASGEIVDDDEVALVYHQEDGRYHALSEPMVNIRATLESAAAAGVISTDTAATTIRTAKGLQYPDRCRAAVLQRMRADKVDEAELAALARFWRDHAVDLKADDARALLRELRDGPGPASPPLALARTESLDTLAERERRVRIGDQLVALADIADHVQLHNPDREAMNTAAMNRGLALTLATLLGIRPTVAQVRREAERWRARHHLLRDDEFTGWLRRNQLSAAEFDTLATEAAQCRTLHRWLLGTRGARRSTALLLDQLRWGNEFEGWAEAAASCAELAEAAESRAPGEVERLLAHGVEALAAMHAEDVGIAAETEVSVLAEEAGFHTTEDLALALARAGAARSELRNRLGHAAGAAPADGP